MAESPEARILETLERVIPNASRWVFVDEALLSAVLSGEPVERGRGGRLLNRFMHAAGLLGMGMLAVRLTGLLETARLFVSQVRQSRRSGSSSGDAHLLITRNIFVGFGARGEEDLFQRFRQRVSGHVIRVDQTRLPETGMAGWPRPVDLWRSLQVAMENIRTAIDAIPLEQRHRQLDFLTTAARRLGTFAYAKAWWNVVRRTCQLDEACFLTADANAFAAISEGIHASFLQHGLITRAQMFPAFNDVYPLTRYEATYLKRRLPTATIHPASKSLSVGFAPRRPCLVIASGERPLDDMMLAAPLVRHMAAQGVTIHVRLFRGESPARFWGTIDLGAVLQIESSDETFDALLDRLQPSFVASWGSTTLVEALYRGVIPITVAIAGDPFIARTVFPLRRCCLRWPEDQQVLDAVFASPAAYQRAMENLRAEEALGDLELDRPA